MILKNTHSIGNNNGKASQHDRHADVLGHYEREYEASLGDCEQNASPDQAIVEDLGGDWMTVGD